MLSFLKKLPSTIWKLLKKRVTIQDLRIIVIERGFMHIHDVKAPESIKVEGKVVETKIGKFFQSGSNLVTSYPNDWPNLIGLPHNPLQGLYAKKQLVMEGEHKFCVRISTPTKEELENHLAGKKKFA